MGRDDIAEQVRQVASVKMLKRAHRSHRKAAKKYRRKQRRRQLRCFWTWPFGHEYIQVEDLDTVTVWQCVGCKKENER